MSDADLKIDWADWGIRVVARALALVWSIGWISFGLVSGIGEGLKPGTVLTHAALPGVIFLATALIAWRWECLGGLLLLLEGIIITAYFMTPFNQVSLVGLYFVLSSATLPALFVGFLFVYSWRKSKAYPTRQVSA